MTEFSICTSQLLKILIFYPSVKHPKSGNVKSNLKPDPVYTAEIVFFSGARVVDFLPLLRKKTDFDCVIENVILNLSLIYPQMSSRLHDIP